MSNHEREQSSHFMLGLGIGAVLGLMFAPRPGKETRERLRHDVEDLIDKGNVIYGDAKEKYETARDKVDPVIKELTEAVAPYVEVAREVSEPYRQELVKKVKTFIEEDVKKELKKKGF